MTNPICAMKGIPRGNAWHGRRPGDAFAFPLMDQWDTGCSEEEQADKATQEAAELWCAISYKQDDLEQRMEAMDTIQAIANLCRIKGWTEAEMAEAYEEVKRKNHERGYY